MSNINHEVILPCRLIISEWEHHSEISKRKIKPLKLILKNLENFWTYKIERSSEFNVKLLGLL